MSAMSNPFVAHYLPALQSYLHGGGEAALKRAYELGRQAIDHQLSLWEVAATHQTALADLLAAQLTPAACVAVAQQASVFFAETLASFEMAQRGFQEALATLRHLNATLEQRVAEQTQALRTANQALQESESLYRTLVEASPDAITLTDLQGNYLFANGQAAYLHGFARVEELLGQNAAAYIAPEDMPRAIENAQKVFATAGVQHLEYTLLKRDSTRFPVELNTARVVDAEGRPKAFIGIIRDITDRKRIEQAQRLLAEAGRLLTTSLDYAATLTSLAQLVVPALADWCAIDMVEEAGLPPPLVVAHSDPAKIAWARELRHRYPPDPAATTGVPQVLRTGQAEIYPEISEAMLAASLPDAEQRQRAQELGLRSAMIVPLVARGRTLGAITFIQAESGRHYGPADLALAEELARRAALAVDNARLYLKAQMALTEVQQLNTQLEQRVRERTAALETANQELTNEIAERKQIEERLRQSREQLRALSAHLQSVREQERTRIAREIHDELGQALTGLKMDAAWLQGHFGENPKLVLKTKSMLNLIDTTVQAVRRISAELRPGILDDLGLAAAIEWQLQEFQTRTDIQCELIATGEEINLAADGATAVFRIFQETLTNVARHAQATQLRVTLAAQANHLLLQVRDNGRGITEAEQVNARSFGLLGMQERILLLAGELTIHGTPGQGTTVTVKIPLGVPD